MTPLGHRILIHPDAPPDSTVAGLVLPADRDHIPVSGVVVAVGSGPRRDQQIRHAAIVRCIGIVEDLGELGVERVCDSECDSAWRQVRAIVDELHRYKNQVERFEATIRVGDRVVYPMACGLGVIEDGHNYILLNEDDAVVIATEEAAVA